MGQGGSMAMEDALVLAEILDAAPDLAAAKKAFVARHPPRVAWARQQHLAVGEMLRLPASVRDPALRERGKKAFCERVAPLPALLDGALFAGRRVTCKTRWKRSFTAAAEQSASAMLCSRSSAATCS